MSSKFASGKWAIAECDVCGFRVKLKTLKQIIIKDNPTNIMACSECWNPSHPQLQLGMYPVNDPQAVRNPRTDSNSYYQSGYNGLQVTNQVGASSLLTGVPSNGSRTIEWGWNPVGGARSFDAALTQTAWPRRLLSIALL